MKLNPRSAAFRLQQLPSARFGSVAFSWPVLRRVRAFTMIEIAISLAIIGFALVAIVGILPLAMNAQRDNRHETIINADASVFLNAVRNGERGLDDLTNYVIGITNYSLDFNPQGKPRNNVPDVWGYSIRGSTLNGASSNPQYPLTNGYSIIGLLSTPKFITHPGGRGFLSNHVVAVFRSMSGPASEKAPQVNPTMQELSLTYKLITDVSPYGTNYYDALATNFALLPPSNTNDIILRSNYMNYVQNMQLNLHDVRLTFLWPLLPNGKLGPGRQVYRTMVAGHLTNTNDLAGLPPPAFPGTPFWFFQPRTFF